MPSDKIQSEDLSLMSQDLEFHEVSEDNKNIEQNYEEDPNEDENPNEEFNDNREEFNDDGEEHIIEDEENDDDFELPDDFGSPHEDAFNQVIQTCIAYLPDITIQKESRSRIFISLPRTFLPLSMQVVYGFMVDPILINITIEVNNFSWNIPPIFTQIEHPVYQKSYIGRHLVEAAVNKFFSLHYEPGTTYRSRNYLMVSDGYADEAKVALLVAHGFDPKIASNALKLYGNRLNDALNFLRTGTERISQTSGISYKECPLLYLILEIGDAFLSLTDHCCVCGETLPYPAIKPSICDKELCSFSFNTLGVGGNICLELKRDPIANDLLISLAAAAAFAPPEPPVFDPMPPNFDIKFFSRLPSVEVLSQYDNDSQLRELLGDSDFETLRFIILANKAQLSTLPDELRVSGFPTKTIQFLITSVSPESELAFQTYASEYGRGYLWHGSGISRWYRILHTGLKVCSGGKYQVHGGKGIYLSDSFYYSLAYSAQIYVPNQSILSSNLGYTNSVLGNFNIISMVEMSPGPKFKPEIPHEFTQNEERGLITRMLIAVPRNAQIDYNYYDINQNGQSLDFALNPGIIDYSQYQGNNLQQLANVKNPAVPSLHDLVTYYSENPLEKRHFSLFK